MPKKSSFTETHPKIVKEWLPTLNGDLTPNHVSKGSTKKVWWKCDKGDDHEWEAIIYSRAYGRGCPICSGKKVVKSNCLSTTHPHFVNQWHPTLNGDLTPNDVSHGSNKKIWWKCDKGDDHEWEASPNTRVSGSGCPCCSKYKISKTKSLANANEKLSKQWHPSKNGPLKPEHINPYSNKKVWWKCDKGDDHEWEATVANRSKGDDCSVCGNTTTVNSNSLKTLRPDLFKELHPTKNGNLNLEKLNAQSRKKVWWKCGKGFDHEWQAEVGYINNNNSGCPVCLNQKVINENSLAFTNPELAKQWHSLKNGDLTPYDFVEGSGKKVWWKCYKEQNHEWKSRIVSRKTSDCPFCQGSQGEKKIEKVLNDLNVAFTQQKTFEGMRYKNKLRCDFYLIDFNLVIQFNGIQHYILMQEKAPLELTRRA